MKSIILQTATRYLLPMLLLFSFFLLFRGHNSPGGGFVGGLVASAAYALYSIAFGVEEAKKLLRIEPVYLIATGLMLALFSGMIAFFSFDTFMTAKWSDLNFPLFGKLGTPLLFDLGVYIVVIGITLKILFTISEEVKP
ncbi:MAG: Na(+)/H(+) antiporter subunit B [Ignavibacteriae bacterium HGW-Ignavibacteriae-1]|jgi:multicomponent Na+:H+ antiporter subunit B|nr:MAG: Na(+)/H(+) antiporter subunit B [Ignavibacteriae bacterium HGW-Ignavibacteriae-1]